MSTFTVQAAAQKKEVPGQHGPMQVIALTLDDGTGEPKAAEWFTKATTPLPQAGSTLEGDLTKDPNYGWKFKRAQQNGGGFRGRSPQETAQIAHMHAQKCALAYAQLRQTQGQLPENFSLDDLFVIARAFRKNVEEVTA